MKIFISGINGYIGSFLANHLISKGYEVDGVARNKNNLEGLNKKIKVYIKDILDIDTLLIKKKYNLFIHLAAANDIDSKNDKDAILVTTLGTKKVLQFCEKNSIDKLIYFSTFQVFGKDSGKINNLSDLNCKNDYAITHLFAEEYITNYAKNKQLDFVIVRPTNVYGATVSKNIKRDTLVPTCFCKDLLKDSKITLLSSGKQYRNFISLKEISKYIKIIIEDFEKYNGQNLILASDINLTIKEVAKITKKVYKDISKKDCIIEVLSKEPNLCNTFVIDTYPLPKLSFSKDNIKKEINKIFKLMS